MIRLIIIMFTVIGSLFFSSKSFVDSCLFPKWLILKVGLLVYLTLTVVDQIYPFDTIRYSIHSRLRICIVFSIFVQACLGIYTYLYISPNLPLTGTLDNPAGFAACLCGGFPFCLYEVINRKGVARYGFISIGFIILIAVVLSESRAGMMSLVAIFLFYIVRKIQINIICKMFIILFVVFLTLFSLYKIKTDSADGRLLIWQCTISMIRDCPIIGWGPDGFKKNYMEYQAKYFQTHNNSPYSQLADNVQHPFSEYLNISANYGIIGLLVLSYCVYFLCKCYYQNPSTKTETAFLSFLAILVFGLFSYPLTYPFVCFLLIYSTIILTVNSLSFVNLHKPNNVTMIFLLFTLCINIYVGIVKLCSAIKVEVGCKKADSLSMLGNTKEALINYDKIYEISNLNPCYLYNYSSELYRNGYYQKGLMIALQCRNLWSNYELELLLGQLYENLSLELEAIQCYKKAALMCPNRFTPLYKLALLLKKMEKYTEMRYIANILINKPAKIPSEKINRIRSEMTKILY